ALTPRAWAASIEKRMAPCLACHGDRGQSTNPEVPSLGAQTSPYILIQLFLFRERMPRLDIMNDAVKGFTDDDLRAFADTIAKLPALASTGDRTDPAGMARGRPTARPNRRTSSHNGDLQLQN